MLTLARRLIACLDVRDGRVVKGVNFQGLRDTGDPAALAARYNEEGIDEIVVLDVAATIERRLALRQTVAAVAARLFIPLAVGGGIRTLEDAAEVIDAGADKVSVNTAALADPSLIPRIAARFATRRLYGHRRCARRRLAVVSSHGGTCPPRGAPWRAQASRGAGGSC